MLYAYPSFACIRHYFPRRGRLKLRPRLKRVTGISPLRGSLRAARRQAYHCVLTRSLRNSLLELFCGQMGTARHLSWPSFMQKSAQAGLGASSRVASRWLGASSGNVSQCRIFNFQRTEDAATGIRGMEKTARGYCSARLNHRPPGPFSTDEAVLPALATVSWRMDGTSQPTLCHRRSGLVQLG